MKKKNVLMSFFGQLYYEWFGHKLPYFFAITDLIYHCCICEDGSTRTELYIGKKKNRHKFFSVFSHFVNLFLSYFRDIACLVAKDISALCL